MLASILNSDTAINVSIQIVRVFNQLREMISNHEELRIKIEELEKEYDARFDRVDMHVQSVFQAFKEIKKLLKTPSNKKKKIGFIQ
jgi:propanediol dehydratase small subunit